MLSDYFGFGANYQRPMDLPDTTGLCWREGNLPVSGKLPVPSRNQPTSVSAGPRPAHLLLRWSCSALLRWCRPARSSSRLVSEAPPRARASRAPPRARASRAPPEPARFPSAAESPRFPERRREPAAPSAPRGPRFRAPPRSRAAPRQRPPVACSETAPL